MAVTKKIGSAVRRNRVKRVLREFFRLYQALLPPATDFVVVPKRQFKPELVTLATVSRDLLPLVEDVRGRILALRAKAGIETSESAAEAAFPSRPAGDVA